ncbi:hypothetical protein C8R45DRAFT_927622 [Mycena sanguinolenta]|nr:hypothetical protein C8R45DRAFT_927622 [Mycena sanguinolenta]
MQMSASRTRGKGSNEGGNRSERQDGKARVATDEQNGFEGREGRIGKEGGGYARPVTLHLGGDTEAAARKTYLPVVRDSRQHVDESWAGGFGLDCKTRGYHINSKREGVTKSSVDVKWGTEPPDSMPSLKYLRYLEDPQETAESTDASGREGEDEVSSVEMMSRARPEALKPAKPGPFRPGQARPDCKLARAQGLGLKIFRPGPARQARAWTEVIVLTVKNVHSIGRKRFRIFRSFGNLNALMALSPQNRTSKITGTVTAEVWTLVLAVQHTELTG